ncbi:MAG: hypothetical protein HQL50_03000, partial [Magnetococcales bacterium]|nr:hypothetical protein [Magnetococcales bacterium]
MDDLTDRLLSSITVENEQILYVARAGSSLNDDQQPDDSDIHFAFTTLSLILFSGLKNSPYHRRFFLDEIEKIEEIHPLHL